MKPRLLDLFCGAGGAAMGYHRSGFDVVGVDIKPQPHYPYSFVEADAIEVLSDAGYLRQFSAIHASPPCQAYTTTSVRWRGAGGLADQRPDLIAVVRAALRKAELPYVIENVAGAKRKLEHSIRLTGEMFGLKVHRARLFECNPAILAPAPMGRQRDAVNAYGRQDNRWLWKRKDGTVLRMAGLKTAKTAMGIDWMDWDELKEAIPPAYTEFIGRQLLQALERVA